MIRPVPTPLFSPEAIRALRRFLRTRTADAGGTVVGVRAARAEDGEFDLELRLVDAAVPPGEGEFDAEAVPLPVRLTGRTARELDGQEIHFDEVRGFRGFLVREAGPSGSRAPGPSSSSSPGRSGDLPVLDDEPAFRRRADARAAAGICDPAPIRPAPTTAPDGDPALVAPVLEALRERVNPLVESHGGAVHLVAVSPDGVAEVEMSGGCQGCAAARDTLTDVVARILRKAVPELSGVSDVTDHAAGEAPWLQPS